MKENQVSKLLFIVNQSSGSNNTDWAFIITAYFSNTPHCYEIHYLTKDCTVQSIKPKISQFSPQCVIAVGGDGTVNLVAQCLIYSDIPLGIIPAGSANGMARELGIIENPQMNLDVILAGFTKKIHLTNINDQTCIHLSDIGLNAFAIKRFSKQESRGMWGYIVASLMVLPYNPTMKVVMKIDKKTVETHAEMIVIANATQYGSGAIINPVGKLDDDLFEVIVIKKVSVLEVLKMMFSHSSFNTSKTEVFQTHDLLIHSEKKVHFQIDGEYYGKVNEIKARLIPNALEVIVQNPQIM